VADAGLLRHERDLTEAVGVLDRREVAAHDFGPALCLHADGAALLEGQLQAANDVA
jgi:hypothetical protein